MNKLYYSPRSVLLGALAAAASLSSKPALADNPVIQHVYTADPAPMVHGDTVYLCTSHDEDVTVDGFFTMNDWFVFSSKDMVNWTDHGAPLSWQTFSWAEANHSWAPHCVARDGKFYMFVPVTNGIGVAVADSPTGPFKDAIGKKLLDHYQYIDPTVFIDDDGQAYLYFGNPKLWYVKLNEDMISYSGGIQQVNQTAQSFGSRSDASAERPTSYEEGPWFYKREDLYYMVYPTGPLPEKLAYSTSPGPTGPWTYGAQIMANEMGHAFTNHPGVIDFKGHSYLFYHTQELPGGGGYKRSVAIEEFTYGANGSIPQISKTKEGVTESVSPLNPFERVEGETMAWGQGIEVEDCSEGGRNVTDTQNGDYIKVESVDFLTGAISFEASVATDGSGGNLELRLDKADGPLIGTCMVGGTGDDQTWDTVGCDVTGAEGVHDLFLVFKASFNLDWWQFEPKDPLPTGTGGADGSGGGASSAGGGNSMIGSGGAGAGGASAVGAGGAGTIPGSSGGQVGTSAGGGQSTSTGGGDGTADGGVSSDEAGCSCSSGAGRSSKSSSLGLLLLGACAALYRMRVARARTANRA